MKEKAFDIDRRWIFLAMLLAVLIPVLMQPVLPEAPTPIVRAVFDKIESLEEGDRVLISLDYDPASKPELGPMNTAFTRHCALKGVRIMYMTLWETGEPMIGDGVNIIEDEFPDFRYGVHYLDLGYAPGHETVIKLITTNMGAQFPVDSRGRPFAGYEIARGVSGLTDLDLVISVGAGYAGTQEWVQYASTPFPDIELVAGVTGVSAPPLYPYYPQQMIGMLPAIKGAAEYEAALAEVYGTAGQALPQLLNNAIADLVAAGLAEDDILDELADEADISTGQVRRMLDGRINCLPRSQFDVFATILPTTASEMMAAAIEDGCVYLDEDGEERDYPDNFLNYAHPDFQEALGRMGPQLSAHLLMLALIVAGNVIFFVERKRRRATERGGSR